MARTVTRHANKKKAMTAKQPRTKNPRRPRRKPRFGENGKSIDFSDVLEDEITVIAPAKTPQRTPSRPKA
jgi:hypothetical protein